MRACERQNNLLSIYIFMCKFAFSFLRKTKKRKVMVMPTSSILYMCSLRFNMNLGERIPNRKLLVYFYSIICICKNYHVCMYFVVGYFCVVKRHYVSHSGLQTIYFEI